MSLFIYLCLEVDIPHASSGAPCNRLYPPPGPPERGPGRGGEAARRGRPRGPLGGFPLPAPDAYQSGLQIGASLGNVGSHLNVPAFRLLTLTHNGCWLTPNSDKCVQRDRQTETGRALSGPRNPQLQHLEGNQVHVSMPVGVCARVSYCFCFELYTLNFPKRSTERFHPGPAAASGRPVCIRSTCPWCVCVS